MRIYGVGCLLCALTFTGFMTNGIDTGQNTNVGFWAIFLGYCVMVIAGFASIIFAYRRLSKPGISTSARNLILKRHALSILIFICTNANIMVTVAYTIFYIPLPQNDPWWTIVLKIMFFLEGLVSPLVRLNEPVFRILIVKTLKSDL